MLGAYSNLEFFGKMLNCGWRLFKDDTYLKTKRLYKKLNKYLNLHHKYSHFEFDNITFDKNNGLFV